MWLLSGLGGFFASQNWPELGEVSAGISGLYKRESYRGRSQYKSVPAVLL